MIPKPIIQVETKLDRKNWDYDYDQPMQKLTGMATRHLFGGDEQDDKSFKDERRYEEINCSRYGEGEY